MAPALLTAFSTASFSATLPLSLECLEQRSESVAAHRRVRHAARRLDEPRGQRLVRVRRCHVHRAGLRTAPPFATQFTVVILALITSMGMAGIPAASLVGIAVILAAVGLPAEAIGVLLVSTASSICARTAINVLADAACTVIVARLEGETGILPAANGDIPRFPSKRGRAFLVEGRATCVRAGDELATTGPFVQFGIARLRAADTHDDILSSVASEVGEES